MKEKTKCNLHDARSISCKKVHFGFFINFSMKRKKNKLPILIINFSCFIFVLNLVLSEVFLMVVKCPLKI